MDFRQDYFLLFELPRAFEVDLVALSQRYQELQKQLHPDRHAAATDQQRRLSLQYTTFVNEAYATLKSPLRRAQYLLELSGHSLAGDSQTTKDRHFLMQQMEWREALADAEHSDDPWQALDQLSVEAKAEQARLYQSFVAAWQVQQWPQAEQCLRQLQFVHKLLDEVAELEERLDD
ncbi:Fe-S protein assembly co-chaperone HscB [Balneatrix alpica]|uniref:Co-chaperone protein HscB homolog n=1 Tax=Balneatrix alpica TaxID=75684 RepID=A0ABV5ZCS1_9GAMM|nr:Fe-S protein assembly co-chaperone HscB [Balneatrix alpica]